MKFGENQKKLYLLAAGLLAVAVALVCAWPLLSGDGASPAPTTAPTQEPVITFAATLPPASSSAPEEPAPSEEAEPATAGVDDTVDVVVYYADNYGYLVPVMCAIPYEEGIAKAALSRMTAGGENDLAAARLGLRTVIPEGVRVDLDIAAGSARIDLSREALSVPDAQREQAMVDAIVLTLTEFDTVRQVEFLVDGRAVESLPCGTRLSGAFERGAINPEDGEGENRVVLYFPGEYETVLVPVTRCVRSNADIETAMLELLNGPGDASALSGVIPEDVKLVSVTVKNGVARIDFTGPLADILKNGDGGMLALRAIAATCAQFDGVEKVELYLDGVPLNVDAAAMAVPAYVNAADDIVYDYIEAQSNAIFDFE